MPATDRRDVVGTVYLVGAGPGDPGLLTVRARELIDTADAIVYDALVNPALVDAAGGDRERHFVGKRGGERSSARQDEIDVLLVRLAREGKSVVRLKGGDPLVFGRGGEEAQMLAAAGVPFEIVPGITAGVAAPAYAGIPVTHRAVSTSVTFVTGHEDPTKGASDTDWAALARVAAAGGTLVLYMGVKNLPAIVERLTSGGLDPATPAAMVEWGTYPRQRTVTATLETIVAAAAREGIGAPTITIVGPVVALRETLRWFDARPLHGRRIVVTRARTQASELRDQLAALGADVIEAPTIRIEPLDPAPLRAALDALATYDWVLFTSRNAVELVWMALLERGADARALSGAKLVAVGPATTESLLERGLVADVVPERFVAEGVLAALEPRPDVRGARFLFPRAAGARELIPDRLRALGATVDEVPLYRSAPDPAGAAALRAALADGGVDLVTFTSSSTVRHFVDAVGPAAARSVRAVSIGPSTTATARELGLDVLAESAQSTIPSLISAVVTALAPRPRAP